jgi:hypothetical protein
MSELLQSGHHPDADQLSAFVEHALPPHERQQTLAHLAICPECRTIVSLSLPPVEESPKLQPAVTRKPWFFGWSLAWSAATAVAALVIVFYVRDIVTTKNSGAKSTQMAVSQAPTPLPADAVSSIPSPEVSSPPPPSKSQPSSPHRLDAPKMAKTQNPQSVDVETQKIADLPIQNRSFKNLAQSQRVPTDNLNNQPSPVAPAAPTAAPAMTFRRNDTIASPSPSTPNNAAAPSITNPIAGASDAAHGAIGASMNSRSFSNLAKNIVAQHPLPSQLPAISVVATGRQTVAIDTQNTVFFSDDDGKHWRAIPSQWRGRAIMVGLVSATINLGQSYTTAAGTARSLPNSTAVGGPIAASPQMATTTLRGTITDASGAAITDASVAVSNATTPNIRTVNTDRTGHYLVADLVPGSYQVEAQAPGFTKQQAAVTLAATQENMANLTLPIGQVSETVSVEASAQLIEPLAPVKKKSSPLPLAGQPFPLFEITTDIGEHWTSSDGQSWKLK